METNHIKPTDLCTKCNCRISVNNIKKHVNICNGKPSHAVRKSNNLKIHPRYNSKNYDSLDWKEIQEFYDDNHTFKDVQEKYNFSSYKLAQFIKKGFLKTRTSLETMKLRGTLKVPKMTSEMREKVSKGMRKAVLEGRQKTPKPYASRLTIYYHNSWMNNIEVLHGGWELKVAKYMDENKINWTKSKEHFTYIFENNKHEYFPDFYLKDHDLYIEVKGPIQAKDYAKWEQFPKKLLIINKNHINRLDEFFIENNLK